jgi:16S rRNA (cytosine967-C5)-methyltransferase
MNPYLRNLLRCTFYQILFLDRVPDYAAADEAVELAKRFGGSRAAGLVNGVVREFLRKKDQIALPDGAGDPARRLSILWSHPDWLVKRWLNYIGAEETEALLRANNQESPLMLRANALKGGRAELIKTLLRAGIEAGPADFSPQGVRIRSTAAIDQLPGWQEGRFIVQGEASQLVGWLLGPQADERVWDACAVPGGKATHLAELMGDRGEVVATDISARGLEKLRQNMQRLGLASIRPFCLDVTGRLTGPAAKPYDRILIDAPCSGLGTLRSHPEAKWRRREEDIARLGLLQKRILARVSSYLKRGGVMVYATCTLTAEENERVVEDFLGDAPDFVLEDANDYLPRPSERWTRGKYFFSLPHRTGADGFFAARMKKAA